MSLYEVYETLSTNLLIGLIIITAHVVGLTCDLGLASTRIMNASLPHN